MAFLGQSTAQNKSRVGEALATAGARCAGQGCARSDSQERFADTKHEQHTRMIIIIFFFFPLKRVWSHSGESVVAVCTGKHHEDAMRGRGG